MLNARSIRVALALIVALAAGLAVRQFAYTHSEHMRSSGNQNNAFYWGNRIVRGANPQPGPATWGSLLKSYARIYEQDALAPVPLPNTLDYVPLRLLMTGVWVNYLNIKYGPVSEWQPAFARSFAAFSMVMELAGAAAMFFLVARVLKRSNPATKQFLPQSWNRWELAAAAAIILWLDPASIVDSHVWPQGETWTFALYLLAVLGIVENRHFLAGICLGLAAMFKGQVLMVAPALIMWPLFERRGLAALRLALGMAFGVGCVVSPWISHGSFAWIHGGFGSVGTNAVLWKRPALNIPYILSHRLNLSLHQRLIPGLPIDVKAVLISTYAILLACCAWGMSRQARAGDRRLLLSLAAPWVLMYFLLGEMDARYLVWGAYLSAAAIALTRLAFAVHLMLTWVAFVLECESLLLYKSDIHSGPLHVLTVLDPLTLLILTIAVVMIVTLSTKSNALIPNNE